MRASNSLKELDEKLNYLCNYCELFLFEAVAEAMKVSGQGEPLIPELLIEDCGDSRSNSRKSHDHKDQIIARQIRAFA